MYTIQNFSVEKDVFGTEQIVVTVKQLKGLFIIKNIESDKPYVQETFRESFRTMIGPKRLTVIEAVRNYLKNNAK